MQNKPKTKRNHNAMINKRKNYQRNSKNNKMIYRSKK